MSTGRSPKIKRTRTRPAQSNKEALGRWALHGGGRLRQALPAYTASDFESDVSAGAVDGPVYACPRARPAHECEPELVPQHHRSTWTHRGIWRGLHARGTPSPAPVVVDLFVGTICFDCRMWMYWRDRQRFFEAHGDHGLGYVRPTSALRRKWDHEAIMSAGSDRVASIDDPADRSIAAYGEMLRAAELLQERERRDLIALAGVPICEWPKAFAWQGENFLPTSMQRYEQATLLAHVRHCLTCYLAAQTNLRQPKPRIRVMVVS